jgi:hypothetical protein
MGHGAIEFDGGSKPYESLPCGFFGRFPPSINFSRSFSYLPSNSQSSVFGYLLLVDCFFFGGILLKKMEQI